MSRNSCPHSKVHVWRRSLAKGMPRCTEIDGLEAVVSTIGAPETLRLIQAALETDVQRFVFLATEHAAVQSIEEELKVGSSLGRGS